MGIPHYSQLVTCSKPYSPILRQSWQLFYTFHQTSVLLVAVNSCEVASKSLLLKSQKILERTTLYSVGLCGIHEIRS